MKILIFGATGMLGSTLFRTLSKNTDFDVYATARSTSATKYFSELQTKLITDINAENNESLINAFIQTKPDVVINCIGLIKQLPQANEPLKAIAINAYLPHQLSQLCKLMRCRFIHISTDCVFSGKKGLYLENDTPDATDVYGRSKLLGEVYDSHAITLRTSIIGHELTTNKSLVNWFLAQKDKVLGYEKAIFSGLPTIELAEVIRKVIQEHPDLTGLYHIAGNPINKHDLLQLIAATYHKTIDIIRDSKVAIDRSLNADLFNGITGYVAPSWPELIKRMNHFSYEFT
ncbi:sugar nucleotide-binding protein [Candidatus Berkiella aquae]|uniref:dTDP-4-dehydrorhamnose reductase n=1 Tax=Candidatus Berkiella aquae TaxID=295108 RepID=A0A0Q9YNI6_9GAMM|nr:SDR family oxidoreductase [Candidatus Berkiella aquae]MCS5712441.1 SDR family oxidoreductase [Candidatus Berkiella aquae]